MEIITSIFAVFFIAMITNNIILTTGYGICSYIGVSKKKSSAIGMGFALVFVTFMAALVSYFMNMILVALDIEFMQTICFILVIASLVQLVEMIVKKFFPSLYNALGIYLPLITTNCVVLYVTKQICDVPTLVEGMGLSPAIISIIIMLLIPSFQSMAFLMCCILRITWLGMKATNPPSSQPIRK